MSVEIKVSVCVITYNQEKYIEQCLQSLVSQLTEFDYEIIVSDDASTDGTPNIIEKYAEKYPNLIKPILNKSNQGPVKNLLMSYRQARGKYISHFDGDDYALPGKLQMQAEILDANPSCVMCSHDVRIVNLNDDLVRGSYRRYDSGLHTLLDLYAQLPFFSHSSKMFVNRFDSTFWERFLPTALDIELHVAQAETGNIYHIDKVLGAYRLAVGVSSGQGRVSKVIYDGNRRIFENALLNPSFEENYIRSCFSKTLFRFAYQSALLGDKEGVGFYLLEAGKQLGGVRKMVLNIMSKPLFRYFFTWACKKRSAVRGYKL